MKVANIGKWVDIHFTEINSKVIEWLQNIERPTYEDKVLREDIYNAEILDELEQEIPVPKYVKDELTTIARICHKNEAGYFRIIYS